MGVKGSVGGGVNTRFTPAIFSVHESVVQIWSFHDARLYMRNHGIFKANRRDIQSRFILKNKEECVAPSRTKSEDVKKSVSILALNGAALACSPCENENY